MRNILGEGRYFPLRCPMKQILDSSSQLQHTSKVFPPASLFLFFLLICQRRPEPAALPETLWKTLATLAPLWHAHLPYHKHQLSIRENCVDISRTRTRAGGQVGVRSGQARALGPRGRRPSVLSAQPPGRFLSTSGPRGERRAQRRTSQASLDPRSPWPTRGRRRDKIPFCKPPASL